MSSDKMNKDFVTVSMMKEMLELQERAFKSAIMMLVNDIRSEVRNLKKDVEEAKYSIRFVSDKYDDIKKNIKNIDNEITTVYHQIEGVNKEMNTGFEDLQWKTEYLENQSRRNNIKITGVKEEQFEKTWDDTEKLVKKVITEKLGIEDEIAIERAHRVGKSHTPSCHVGSASQSQQRESSRPIVAKIKCWKMKENILRATRKRKPKGVQFMGDFAKRTLDRRASMIPNMLEARKEGKIAFLVMDQLITYDKKDRPPWSETEDHHHGLRLRIRDLQMMKMKLNINFCISDRDVSVHIRTASGTNTQCEVTFILYILIYIGPIYFYSVLDLFKFLLIFQLQVKLANK